MMSITQRMTSLQHRLLRLRVLDGTPNLVVLCVWYLRAKEREAEGFALAIEGALAGLGIPVGPTKITPNNVVLY
jgi:hypothetical protein